MVSGFEFRCRILSFERAPRFGGSDARPQPPRLRLRSELQDCV